VKADRFDRSDRYITRKYGQSAKHKPDSRSLRRRTTIMLIFVEICFALLIGHMFWIQCIDGEKLRLKANIQHHKMLCIHPRRGAIYDRKGKPLAISTKSYSLYGDPSILEKPELVAGYLSPILGLSKDDILRKFDSEKRFVWLKRQLPEQIAENIRLNNFKGWIFRRRESVFIRKAHLLLTLLDSLE